MAAAEAEAADAAQSEALEMSAAEEPVAEEQSTGGEVAADAANQETAAVTEDDNLQEAAAAEGVEAQTEDTEAAPETGADSGPVIVEEPNSDTPSVKEIIRRVGDLARELERAEAERKAVAEDESDMEADPPMDSAASA